MDMKTSSKESAGSLYKPVFLPKLAGLFFLGPQAPVCLFLILSTN